MKIPTATLALLLALVPAGAQTAAPEPPPDNPERPEYRARSLPNDTFNPREKVAEDSPVPFPEDI
jgi:hypothetical protein